MKQTDKPVIVPTVVSLRGLLWSVVLVIYFLAALAVYVSWGRYDSARAELARPVETPVAGEFFETTVPAGWNCYEQGTNFVSCFKDEVRTLPMFMVATLRDPANAYRAIDLNPALAERRITQYLAAAGMGNVLPSVIDVDLESVKPGTSSSKAIFTLSKSRGIAYTFYRGDLRYFIIGVWSDDDTAGREEVCSRIEHIYDRFVLPDFVERFTRPIINSAEQEVGEHTQVLNAVAREQALWKMFADRVEAEPEVALMPAILHYRKSLELLSSLREERLLLESDDFKRYSAFLARRAELVRKWFILLDKYLATGDRGAARAQAEFIVKHATLEEESLDRRRAGARLAELNAEEGNG